MSRRSKRGSSMVESAFVTATFLILLMGVADFGRLGFAYNSVAYAAHHAARWASTQGSGSGHPATQASIQTNVQNNVTALDTSQLSVAVTWNPNNNPGSTVQVQVIYNFKTLLIPVSSTFLRLTNTSTQVITQ